MTQVLVSTLPATTAAGGFGFSMQPGGTITCSGFRQPALSGMSSSTSVRKTYSTAAIVTALARARTRVLAAHRANTVEIATPLLPDIDLIHTARVDTGTVLAQGNVIVGGAIQLILKYDKLGGEIKALMALAAAEAKKADAPAPAASPVKAAALLLVCALGLVTSQHESRKLFTQLEREQERARALDVELLAVHAAVLDVLDDSDVAVALPALAIAMVETAAGKVQPGDYDRAGFDLLWFTAAGAQGSDPCATPLPGLAAPASGARSACCDSRRREVAT